MVSLTKKIAALQWRRFGKIIGSAIGILLLVSAGAFIYIDTDAGHEFIADTINSSLKTPESEVHIRAINGSLFSDVDIANVTLSDEQGMWLELTNIKASWKPWALLTGRAHIIDLNIEKLDFKRTPSTSGEPTEDDEDVFTLPSLPLDIEISRYSVSEIIIGETLTNIASEFTLDGALKLTNADGMTAKLDLINTSGSEDAVRVDASYPSDWTDLNIDMIVTAPGEGFFLSLIGPDFDKDLNVTLSGQGPIDNWSGEFDALLDSQNISHARITRIGEKFSISSQTEIADFLPAGFASLGTEPLYTDINIEPVDNNDYSQFSISIGNNIARIEAEGPLLPDQPGFISQLNLSAELLKADKIEPFISPTFVEPLTINGILSDIASDPKLMLTFENAKIGVRDQVEVDVTTNLNASLVDQVLGLHLTGNVQEISGSAVQPILPLLLSGVTLTLDGTYDQRDDTATLGKFAVANEYFEIATNGSYNVNSGGSAARINAVSTDLSQIASAMGMEQGLSGTIALNIDASKLDRANPLNAELLIETNNLAFDNLIAEEILGESPALRGSFSQSPEGAVELNSLSLEADFISIDGSASLSEQQVINESEFNISLNELENIESISGASVSGNIDIDGVLSGDIASPSINFETGFDALDVQGLELTNFRTKVSANNVFTDITGDISATGQSNFGDLNADISLIKQDENITVPDIQISLGAYNATGNISISPSHPIVGNLSLKTDAGVQDRADIRGDISADITFSDENNNQKLNLNGIINDLLLQLDESDTLGLRSLEINADLLLTENEPKITMSANMQSLMHPSVQVEQASVQIDQTTGGIHYGIVASGTETMPYQIDVSGDMKPNDNNGQDITASMEGSIGETPVTFKHDGVIEVTEKFVSLPPFVIQLGDGQLDGTVQMNGDNLRSDIVAHNADLEPLRTLFPDIPLTGLLSGTMNLEKKAATLNNNIDLTLSNINFGDQSVIDDNGAEITVRGTITEKRSDISGTATLRDIFNADFSAEVPLTIDPLTFEASIDELAPVKGLLNWDGEITQIWPTLKLVDHDLAGDMKAEFGLGGSVGEPDVDGKISLANGRYENMQTGFVANDIDMNATIIDRHLTLDQFGANDGENGTINATADITIEPDLTYDASIQLQTSNAKLVRQPELNIVATSILEFLKNQNETTLKGDITIDTADIGAIEQSSAAVTVLDVTEINSEGVQIEKQEEGNKIGPVDLDLNLNVPGRLFIRSFGLDSEWKADLTVTGTSEAPIISGTASQIRGFFEFSGKRFNITRGTFSFPGDASNDPIIEIAAEHQLPDMVANLRIYGRASNPRLEMTSTPYLPENEVMARILFGTSVEQLTAIEAVQLASAVHSLSNGGGQGLLGGIRRVIGVDRLSIDNDASREYGTTITGGKYLADNVYVEVSTAPATGQTATSVEVGLTRNLSLVTRRTLDHDNNLSIKWFWDY